MPGERHSSIAQDAKETDMKFMVILKGDKYCEPGSLSSSLLAEMAKFNGTLLEAGVLLVAEEFHPSARAARVERSNGETAIVHGPFAEPDGLMAGFWVLHVASLREAIEWVMRCPLADKADARFVIRQLHDFGDFSAEEMPDLERHRKPPVAA
jgi:hypothetical protein